MAGSSSPMSRLFDPGMSRIKAACGREILVDSEDLPALAGYNWQIGSHGYAQRWVSERGKPDVLHRLLLGLMPGDRRQVDHKDRNKLDNRRSNLRITTPAQNSQNVPRPKRNVYPNHGRWMARVKLRGKNHYLGTYDDPEEAVSVAAAFRAVHMTHAE